MRVLVTGGAGLLGSELVARAPHGIEVAATVRGARVPPTDSHVAWHSVELTNSADTAATLRALRPDVVIHTAYRQESRADIVDASESIARACGAVGSALIHLSTDAVFDGEHAPYGELDPTGPVLEYGRWKLEAERAVTTHVSDAAIVRPSLIVRLEPPDRATAVVLAAAEHSETGYRFFHDEIRTPIHVSDLAAELWALAALPRRERSGTWHLPGAEPMSRYELACRIAAHHGADPSVLVSASVCDHPTRRARDLTTTSERRQVLGHPPSPL